MVGLRPRHGMSGKFSGYLVLFKPEIPIIDDFSRLLYVIKQKNYSMLKAKFLFRPLPYTVDSRYLEVEGTL